MKEEIVNKVAKSGLITISLSSFLPDEKIKEIDLSSFLSNGVLKEKELVGELVYSNKLLSSLNVSVGDIVGFTPGSEYEFNIEDQKLYRILLNDITINYGRKKNKRETTQSC